jgi:hypothetical protein
MLVVITSLATLIYASLLEWAVHRFGYHDARVWKRATDAHHLHHEVRYPKSRFIERGDQYHTSQPFWLEAAYVVAHTPAFVAIAWLSVPAAIAAFVVLGGYAALAHYVHPATHLRTGRWYERTKTWKKIVSRHAKHHADQRVNFNVVLPLGDLLFGTYARKSERRRLAEGSVEST